MRRTFQNFVSNIWGPLFQLTVAAFMVLLHHAHSLCQWKMLKISIQRIAELDTKAVGLQRQLACKQKMGLVLTFFAVFIFGTFGLVLRTPALQVLCPVAVFLLIQYLDNVRKSERTFKFASLRLAAETLRLMVAARDNSGLMEFIFSARGLSTHPVANESAAVCNHNAVLLASEVTDDASRSNSWEDWLEQQTAYYANSSKREQARSRHGLRVFNTAFFIVALIGAGAFGWSLYDPNAAASDLFRSLMAAASVIGSCGLAYISFVRERKAFDQSFDYERMYQVLSGAVDHRVTARAGTIFDRMVVTETLNEHLRWALRMAGHFKAAK